MPKFVQTLRHRRRGGVQAIFAASFQAIPWSQMGWRNPTLAGNYMTDSGNKMKIHVSAFPGLSSALLSNISCRYSYTLGLFGLAGTIRLAFADHPNPRPCASRTQFAQPAQRTWTSFRAPPIAEALAVTRTQASSSSPVGFYPHPHDDRAISTLRDRRRMSIIFWRQRHRKASPFTNLLPIRRSCSRCSGHTESAM